MILYPSFPKPVRQTERDGDSSQMELFATSGLLCGKGLGYNIKAQLCYSVSGCRLCRLRVISSIMQKVLRAASYSTVSYSA